MNRRLIDLGRAFAFLSIAALSPTSTASALPCQRSVVYLGWDSPTPATFRSEVLPLEAAGVPIDGTVINFTARFQGTWRPFSRGFAGSPQEQQVPGPLQAAWLQDGIDDMLAVSPSMVTENFLRFLCQPGSVDFFDDAGWTYIIETSRLAGYAAREAGLEGILFDPEPYIAPFAQFDYLRQPARATHTFEEYRAQARLRGRQFMDAVQSEFPDVTILALFLNSYQLANRYRGPSAYGLDDPSLALVGGAYALLPSFIDGWLDVMGPDVVLVDGHEESYYNTSEYDFELQKHQMLREGIDLVSQANRTKYASQVEVGMSVYMDAYEASHPLALDLPQGMTYPELYEANLGAAMRVSEGYVWLYGETGSFFTLGTTPTWNDKFPWILPATFRMRNASNWPVETREVIDAAKKTRTRKNRVDSWASQRAKDIAALGLVDALNMVQNPGFSADLDSWGLYNDPELNSVGSYEWSPEGSATPGSVRLTGANAASVFQTINVTPGETLWVSADFRRTGRSEPSIHFGWRTAGGSFIPRERTQFFAEEYEPVAAGQTRFTDWRQIQGALVVPELADRLVMTLDCMDQVERRDELHFDDVVLLRVGQPGEAPTDDAVGAGSQPLANFGFENGLLGWQVSSTGPVEIVADAFSGSQAIRSGPAIGGFTREVPIEAGQRYQLRGFAKRIGENDGCYFGVKFLDAAGQTIAGSFKNRAVRSRAFEEYAVTGEAPAGAESLVLYGWKEEPGSYLVVDDVRLRIRDALGKGGLTAR